MEISTRSRRGGYNIIMGVGMTAILASTAIAVDWGRVVLANAQAQHVADSAAEAAIIALKATGSATEAETVAARVVALNDIGGAPGTLTDFVVGEWDNAARAWTAAGGQNGVHVEVGRVEDNAVDLTLSKWFGWDSADVVRGATAATQNLEVVLVMDITASWDQDNFYKARTAAVDFLDRIHAVHGSDDVIGMVVFYQRFGLEFSPFTKVTDSAANSSLLRSKWAALNVGSFAGQYQSAWATQTSKHYACKIYSTYATGSQAAFCSGGSPCWNSSLKDSFTSPAGGCFPNLPRYYSDEGGTDHTTGMTMAQTMFSERSDPMAYRAQIVLTDGQPVGYTTSTGSRRASQGYTETRWRQYARSSSHTASQIQTDTVTLANTMYTTQSVNTWFVSFVATGDFMEEASKGDGYFVATTTAADIIPVFDRIARSLPVAVVQ